MQKRLVCLMLLSAAFSPAAAEPGDGLDGLIDLPALDGSGDGPPMAARLVPEYARVVPGQSFHVAVELSIDDGWAYYSPEPGEADGVAPESAHVAVAAEGLEVREPLWPEDEPYGDGTRVYKKQAVLYVRLAVPRAAELGPRTVRVEMEGQVCEELCIPLTGPNAVTAETTVAVGEEAEVNPAWLSPGIAGGLAAAEPVGRDDDAAGKPPKGAGDGQPAGQLTLGELPSVPPPDYSVGVALGIALLAGLILNIMPCVLPIIPLRIYSLVNMAGESRRRFVTLGLAFAFGIILFFVGVAAANAILKLAAGRALNWSEHWQFPLVRAGLGLMVVVLAANLLGAFDVTVPSKVAGMEGEGARQGHAGAAGMGLMMAILATPCSAAFVIAVMGWAQGQPLWLGTLAIVLMGVGMAAPHALLTAFPKLVEKLPKPGRWMEILKQSMGFILLPVAVWLFSTLRGGYGAWVSGYAVAVGLALWMWGRWVRYDAALWRRLLVKGIAVAIIIGGGIWVLPPTDRAAGTAAEATAVASDGGADASGGGRASESAIAEALSEDRIAVVKFTADWCIECKVVERTVYRDEEVKEALSEPDVAYFVGDVTDKGSPAANLLSRMRGAPPLTAVFAPGRDPIYLPGGIGPGDLLGAIERARGR